MLLLVGCTDHTIALGDSASTVETVPGVVDPDTAAPDDTAPAVDTGDVDTEPSADELFSLDRIHTVAITMTDDAFDGLTSDLYSYQLADVEVDGSPFPSVGVRIKGRLGSLRYPPQKSAFKVDFLEYGGTDKLAGLEKINLNNMVQDCAKTHELAAYGVYRAAGIPAPRVGYAQVTLNGEDYGLYSLVEDYDDEFLQDNFDDPSGNLYDGDYYLWPNGSYQLVDFTGQAQPFFQLDEGVDVAQADLTAVTTAIAAATPDTFDATVGALVDLDQHAAFLAAAAWTGHYDSYTYYSNNYRVYFDPGRGGKAVFLAWDPDWAFYSSTAIDSPYGVVSQGCLRSATCRAAVGDWIETLSATVPGSELEAQVEAAMALVQPALEADPKLEQNFRDIRACQVDQLDWFSRRGGELAGWPR